MKVPVKDGGKMANRAVQQDPGRQKDADRVEEEYFSPDD